MPVTYDTSDLRKGLKIMMDGVPYIVIECQFVKPGKGAAFTRTRMKNLLTGGVVEKNIRSGEKMEGADVEDREVTFLYKEGDGTYVFMDKTTYDQTAVSADVVDEAWRYLKENLDCQLTFYNGRPIAVTLPNFVELRVTATEPGVRGDTATGASKPATLETGATINVPLFINEGEVLRIDTRTGEYLERVRG
ncbi:MAG: elongation factor P [Myxococcales bacterium]|nr:elongation factor P [Myxococcota bacterium]MDW8281983.1 elongation factor P [Myxococcales bacterium]